MSFGIGVTLSFVAAIAWGSSMVIFKVGIKNTDPLVATYIKGIVAVPVLILLGWILYGVESLALLFTYPNSLWLLLATVSITFGDFFSLFALKKINVSIAQPISAVYPFFTTLILLIAKIEKITWVIITGTLLIIFGVSTISYFTQRTSNQAAKREHDKNNGKNTIYGIILSVLAATFWGLTIVFTRLILDGEGVEVISMMGIRNGLMVAMAFILVLIRANIKRDNFMKNIFTQKKEAFILMGGGAIAWCIGGVSFFTAVTMIGAGISTPLSSISPFIVTILSVFFLKETITKKQILSIFIIVLGAVILSLNEIFS